MDFSRTKKEDQVVGRDIIKYPHTPEGDEAFDTYAASKITGEKKAPLYPQNVSMSVPEYEKQEAARQKNLAEVEALKNSGQPITLSNVGAPVGAVKMADGAYAYRSPISSTPVAPPKTDEQIYQETHAQYKSIVDRLNAPHGASESYNLLNQLNEVGAPLKEMTLKRMDLGLPLNPGVVDTGGSPVVRPAVAPIGSPGPEMTTMPSPGAVTPMFNRAPVVAGAFPASISGLTGRPSLIEGIRKSIRNDKNKFFNGL